MKGAPALAVYGPMFIGLVFNILLYGTMLAQVYMYFTNYKSDRNSLKTLVIFLLLLDTFNTVAVTLFVYDGLVTHFGRVDYIQYANWYLATEPTTTGLAGLVTQLFYAWRIYVLIESWTLVLLIVSVSLTGGAGAVYITYKVVVVPEYERWGSWHGINEPVIWLAAAGVADLLITTSLVWYLRRHKTGFGDMNMVIDRIIRLTMQTGLLTSVVAIVNLFVFLCDATGTHLLFNTPLSKIYSNSLMSSLNARKGWKFNENTGVSSRMTNLTFRSFGESTASFISRMTGRTFRGSTTNPEVIVDAESHKTQDHVLQIAKERLSTSNENHGIEGDSSTEHVLHVEQSRRRNDDRV